MAVMSTDKIMEINGGLDPFAAPTPGESLTADPEARLPFEKPPKHVDMNEAVQDMFMRLTEDEQLDDVLDLMRKEIPVDDIAQTILFTGFQQGMYTPDVMLQLIEPTMYMLLSLAEVHGIEADIYPEEDFPETDDEELMQNENAVMSVKDLIKMGPVNKKQEEVMEEAQREEPMEIIKRTAETPMPQGVTASMLDRIRQTAGQGAAAEGGA